MRPRTKGATEPIQFWMSAAVQLVVSQRPSLMLQASSRGCQLQGLQISGCGVWSARQKAQVLQCSMHPLAAGALLLGKGQAQE